MPYPKTCLCTTGGRKLASHLPNRCQLFSYRLLAS